MVLFQTNQLPPGLGEDQFVVKFVVLRRRRIIVHVAARQVVFVRESVVHPGREVVFGGDLGTRKGEDPRVTIRSLVRQRIEREIR